MTNAIKVMMVDDEARFRETTRKILAKKGFDTLLAADGPEALEKLPHEPDVVVLDIKMPGMDGHEVLARIKKANPALPVIMLTGHGDRPSAKQALAHGAFDYLTKPCDIDLLADKIKEACRQRKDPGKRPESCISDIMIPFGEYTTVPENATISQAVAELKKSFVALTATSRLMETGHRSVLVLDGQHRVSGILTIRDLLESILPAYLSAPKPSLADSIEYSPMFWQGMFSARAGEIRSEPIRDIMSPTPVSIDSRASLMAAAHLMVTENQRRLIVTESGRPTGVIREQDLFFELEKQLRIGFKTT